jgi:hypothetical protein
MHPLHPATQRRICRLTSRTRTPTAAGACSGAPAAPAGGDGASTQQRRCSAPMHPSCMIRRSHFSTAAACIRPTARAQGLATIRQAKKTARPPNDTPAALELTTPGLASMPTTATPELPHPDPTMQAHCTPQCSGLLTETSQKEGTFGEAATHQSSGTHRFRDRCSRRAVARAGIPPTVSFVSPGAAGASPRCTLSRHSRSVRSRSSQGQNARFGESSTPRHPPHSASTIVFLKIQPQAT